MILRLRTRDGTERIDVADNDSLRTLKEKVEVAFKIPLNDQILSKDQGLLHSKTPEQYHDLVDLSKTVSSLGLVNGEIVYLRYTVEREITVAAQPTTKAFGSKMTMGDLIAAQTRIENQEDPDCKSVSFDRDAANVFQSYVHQSIAFSVQRGGWMYGTKDEEGNVKVDFIYEPAQEGSEDAVVFVPAEEEVAAVDFIANALGVERVGWIFSTSSKPRDFEISDAEVAKIAEMQAEGGDTFVTAVVSLSVSEEGANVHFEAFQCSRQACQLWRDGYFASREEPTGVSLMAKDVVVAGRDVRDVDNEWFIIPVKILDHGGPLSASFPVENRLTPQGPGELRSHLQAGASRPYVESISDFHLLLFLAKRLDLATDMALLLDAVRNKGTVLEGYKVIIESIAGM